MGVLRLLVKDGHAAVHMVLLDVIPSASHQIEQNTLTYISQIPGNNPAVIFRRVSKVFQVLMMVSQAAGAIQAPMF